MQLVCNNKNALASVFVLPLHTPGSVYGRKLLPRMIISLGASLLASSSGGVTGATEPSLIPMTQILLAPP